MKKNNKFVYGFVSIAATALMAIAPSVGVFADDTPAETSTTATSYKNTPLTSNAQVVVEEGGIPTNPNDPSKPITDVPDLPNTNVTGEDLLQLVAVPDLNFGKVKAGDIESAAQTLNFVDTTVKDGKNKNNGLAHLTVSDYRGTLAGWKLSASMTDFTNLGDASSAHLTGSIDLINHNVGQGVVGATDKTFLASGYQTLDTKVKLPTTNTAATIWDAPKGQGYGMTIADLSASKLNLDLKQGAKTGTYQSTITWTLSSTAATPEAGTGKKDGAATNATNSDTTTNSESNVK